MVTSAQRSECECDAAQPSKGEQWQRLWLHPGSQMPRRLIGDAREWIGEILTVSVHHPAKPQPRERAWDDQLGKKTLLSLTLAILSG